MSLESSFHCPECGEQRSFWKTASMTVHIGTKTKWECTDCGYRLVRIGSDVDSSRADS